MKNKLCAAEEGVRRCVQSALLILLLPAFSSAVAATQSALFSCKISKTKSENVQTLLRTAREEVDEGAYKLAWGHLFNAVKPLRHYVRRYRSAFKIYYGEVCDLEMKRVLSPPRVVLRDLNEVLSGEENVLKLFLAPIGVQRFLPSEQRSARNWTRGVLAFLERCAGLIEKEKQVVILLEGLMKDLANCQTAKSFKQIPLEKCTRMAELLAAIGCHSLERVLCINGSSRDEGTFDLQAIEEAIRIDRCCLLPALVGPALGEDIACLKWFFSADRTKVARPPLRVVVNRSSLPNT